MYADSREVQLVPGVELSCAYEGHDIHILAYAFDPLDERVEERLRSFRETRQQRGKRMVGLLNALGFKIDHARVEQLAAGGAMGRPHVARALVEAGYVKTVAEAFDKLIGAGKPAYVEKERFQIEEAVALIHSAGGVTSIAHPTLYPDHERSCRNCWTPASTRSKSCTPTSTTRIARCIRTSRASAASSSPAAPTITAP